MTNMNKLRGKIVENGMSVSELAEKIGMDKSTLYRKLNNNAETLLVKEAKAIASVLGLTSDEAAVIFFGSIVA